MNMDFFAIPAAELVSKYWAAMRPDLQLVETAVLAYRHTMWIRPRSSPRNNYACLVLARFSGNAASTWLVAPIYKCGNKESWGGSDIECGDRFNPPLPDYEFYPALPTLEALHDFAARSDFSATARKPK